MNICALEPDTSIGGGCQVKLCIRDHEDIEDNGGPNEENAMQESPPREAEVQHDDKDDEDDVDKLQGKEIKMENTGLPPQPVEDHIRNGPEPQVQTLQISRDLQPRPKDTGFHSAPFCGDCDEQMRAQYGRLAGYRGNPQCDECGRPNLHRDPAAWHCPTCKYDLCTACAMKQSDEEPHVLPQRLCLPDHWPFYCGFPLIEAGTEPLLPVICIPEPKPRISQDKRKLEPGQTDESKVKKKK
jgi:hypothetical protein